MTKKDITDAYSILRTTDGTIEAIPYEVIEYMRDAAIEKLTDEEARLRFKKQLLSNYELVKRSWKLKRSMPNT